MIDIAAGETEKPEKNVPKAIHAAVWRLIIFFVGTIIVMSSLLTYTDTGLQVGGHGSLVAHSFQYSRKWVFLMRKILSAL